MLFKKFEPTDVIYNTLVTNPKYKFIIHGSKTYINNEILNESAEFFSNEAGTIRALEKHVPSGHISLYEYNINRDEKHHIIHGKSDPKLIYPFITKEGARTAFSTITTSEFADSSQFNFGDQITGSYPLSASINRVIVSAAAEPVSSTATTAQNLTNKKYIRALKNILNDNVSRSPHFAYESSLGNWEQKEVNMICVPSIFYGARINPGSVKLRFYVTGSLIGELTDSTKNGELIQTSDSRVAGVVLYDQGLCLLTGSWNITEDHTEAYDGASSAAMHPRWLEFGIGMLPVPQDNSLVDPGTNAVPSSSFTVEIEGVNKIPTMTMFAHSLKGEHNLSTNTTFFEHGSTGSYASTEFQVVETPSKIKNINKSPYKHYEEGFENITYISKVGIYDKDHNLIAVAKLANPVKKKENVPHTFKLKLDL